MNGQPNVCERRCSCKMKSHQTGLIVVTGGPGAGKTAILEMAKKAFCHHIAVLPEAASIIFGGGFWRLNTMPAKMAAQRAIFHVQREMEELVLSDNQWALGLCDRGALDGLAYWPSTEELFWQQVGSQAETEFLRYQAVIHLRTPTEAMGYNHQNELRIESPEEAHIIDKRIEKIWSRHPKYIQIPSSNDFLTKAELTLRQIELQIPDCCGKMRFKI